MRFDILDDIAKMDVDERLYVDHEHNVRSPSGNRSYYRDLRKNSWKRLTEEIDQNSAKLSTVQARRHGGSRCVQRVSNQSSLVHVHMLKLLKVELPHPLLVQTKTGPPWPQDVWRLTESRNGTNTKTNST